ncbi:hypothetical protein [Capnocytophaga gingivalis]|jgi:hypothetical protein|uniref:hypothetical protein n=1 Tax=Capnocytophaga gingivalis TaxID=1017 RepID=UPI002B4A0BF0|nr:hypothetical protein [Capnocytophaga gingivalis]MEB3015161.1 hypothetical protein [Capnocytophaga gingivalis]
MEGIKDFTAYEICDLIRKRNLGEPDMLKILKEYTEGYNLELLEALHKEVENYIGIEKDEMRGKISKEEIDDKIKEYKELEKELPVLDMSFISKIDPKAKATPILDLEQLFFPFEFFSVYQFQKMIISKIKEKRQKNNQEEIQGTILDFSEDKLEVKTNLVILQKLGIFDYLIKEHQLSVNKIASLLSSILGVSTTTLQSYINPMLSPNTESKNAPTEKHINKAMQILRQLDIKIKEGK